MRSPNLTSVHISVDRRVLDRWKKHAEEFYNGLLSQAVRSAMEDAIARSQGRGLLELRPIIEEQKAIKEILERGMDILTHVDGNVESLRSTERVNLKVLLDAIERVLEEAGSALPTEEVKDRLLGHTIHEVRRGLEILDDKFIVESFKQCGKTMWRLLGADEGGK